MRLLIMFLFVISTVSANAALNGKWSGAVEYSDSEGNAMSSEQNIYLFPYAANHVYFADTFWGYQLDLEIRNGELFYGEQKVGTASDNQFKIFVESDDCTWKTSSTIGDDGQLTFIDGYACEDGYFDHTEGTLSPASQVVPTKSVGQKSLRSLTNTFRKH